jgi:predicted transcriptional regulator
MENEAIIALTSDIVCAHLSHNAVDTAAVPNLIRSVFTALAGLGASAPAVNEKREPAVSIRSSVKPDALTCLECGTKFKVLKRHLRIDHHLSPADYRARWKLNGDYPLVAPDYAATRRDLAIKIGLGQKPAAGAKRTSGRKRGPSSKIVAA